MQSLINLIHTPLYGEMLLALGVLGFFAGRVLSGQGETVTTTVSRCTMAVFGLYIIVRIVTDGVTAPGTLITYAFRAFVAAGLTFCASSFGFSAIAISWNSVVAPARNRWGRAVSQRQSRAEERRRAEEQAFEQRTEQEERARRETEDAEQRAVDTKRQADEHALKAERDNAVERAWFHTRLFYDSLPAETRTEFTLQQLSDYFNQFIGSKLTQAEITERTAKIREMLTDRAKVTRGEFASLESIIQHFQALRESVLSSGLAEDQADSLIADLEMDQARAIRAFREQS